MKLIKVNISSELRYYHRFKLTNGTIVEEETTKKQFYEISSKDVVNPIMIGAVWVSSGGQIKFDTPIGKLSDGEYATQDNGPHWVKLVDCDVVKVDSDFIKDDNISDAKILEIKAINSEIKVK